MVDTDRLRRFFVCALFAVLPGAGPLAAQSGGVWAIGASGAAGLFVGSGSDFLDAGLGVDVVVSRRIVPRLQLRADGMFMLLDEQSDPLETADNRILLLSVGPEFDVALGPVSLYVRGVLGAAANFQLRTGSALKRRTSWASAFGASAGLRLRVATALDLDLGGDLLRLGELDFTRTASFGSRLIKNPSLLRLRAGLRLTGRPAQ